MRALVGYGPVQLRVRPPPWIFGLAEKKFRYLRENNFRTDTVCQHHEAALLNLLANHDVGGPVIVTALGETTAVWPLPRVNPQAGGKVDRRTSRIRGFME